MNLLNETMMLCCQWRLSAELEREQGIAFAVWRCPTCDTEAYQAIGEIDNEKAKIKESAA